ncbi:MAG: molybdate-binding protein [Ruminococcaceae bacterium]|nr:molybdate-binding protein [Oscillospiraceae bacterium]
MEKALLTLEEFCQYLAIGKTKGRELLTKTNNTFTVRIGNRLYANKLLLDKWLMQNSGNYVETRKRGK